LAVWTFLIAESAEYENDYHWQAFTIALKHCSTLAAGTICSILTYRAAFHRLNVFPGPFKARLSNLYVTALGLKKRHLYKEVQELHRKYGDVVRIGLLAVPASDSQSDSDRAFGNFHQQLRGATRSSLQQHPMCQRPLVQHYLPNGFTLSR
jgi:hypothetical protein